jgi:CelD/BcsL family acetyltransferase involved in cellulose biosynthesis
MVTAYPGVGPFRARCLQFVGADPNLTELRGPLWAQGFEKAGVHALARDVARHASEWDWMAWNGIPANSSAAAILDRHVTWHTATPYYTLSLEGDWPGFKSRLGRNVKESLRKCYNSLKRDGLEHALSVVTQRADVETALHDFFRLHGERASANTTVRHPNYFQRPVNRAFLVDVCERLADRGQLRILRLHVGNRLVAVRIAFALRGSLYLYYSGYEAEYGKYSVMTTLVAETIQYAFAAGVTSVNLSVGNDVSKTRWSPREWVEYSAVTRSTRSRGRFAHAVYQLVDRALHAHEIRDYARALFSSAPSTAAA